MNVRVRDCIVVVVLALLMLVPLTGEAQDRVRAALPSIGTNQMLHYVALEQGYYRDEGIEASFEVTAPVVGVQATIAGEFQFNAASNQALAAAMKGAPLKIIFSQTRTIDWWLMAQPGVTTLQALKGKTIGIEGPGSFSEAVTREALKRQGLDPDRDVNFIGVGAVPNWYLSLKGGAVAAAITAGPQLYLLAKREGFQELFPYGDHVRVMISGLAPNEKLLREKPDLVRRFIRASLKGLWAYLDREEVAVTTLMQVLKLPKDQAAAIYRLSVQFLNRTGVPSEETIAGTIQIRKADLGIKSEENFRKLFDFTLTQEAGNSLLQSGWTPR